MCVRAHQRQTTVMALLPAMTTQRWAEGASYRAQDECLSVNFSTPYLETASRHEGIPELSPLQVLLTSCTPDQ